MTFSKRVNSAPLIYDAHRGDEVLSLFDNLPQNCADLIAGTASCSPYLRGLLIREVDWVQSVLNSDSVTVLDSLLIFEDNDPAQVLRRAKGRMALWVALCDLGGVWELEAVTDALTRFADAAVAYALNCGLQAEVKRGKLAQNRLDDSAGVAILAMGKMGAGELNYSSDIDLIVLFDETTHNADDYFEIRTSLIRATKFMAKLLSEVTKDGYVFRTDLRLRPDPSVTPVCMSMDAAERYYESLGRTWERAAFIKARVCAGDQTSGEAFLKRLTPFVWRKHLDFAAIQDAHDMRLRIRDHKGLGGALAVAGHNMKLGVGGIREIEFFAQTRQLIAGGRDSELRAIRTMDALTILADKDWIPKQDAVDLRDAYRAHRTLEHRIQMIGDAQTHNVPKSLEARERLAAFCGWSDLGAFEADILGRLGCVRDIIERFFAPDKSDVKGAGIPEHLDHILEGWTQLPALRSPRALEIFKRLKPKIAAKFGDQTQDNTALMQLDGFVRGLPAGVQLFSLLEANPQILDLLIDICALAPSLASYLSRNTSVFDGVLSGRFFEPLPSSGILLSQLKTALHGIDDYEDQLNIVRRWHKELHFRIGVLQLRGIADVPEAAQAYSDLAQACLDGILPLVAADFERRYGVIEDGSMAVLSMGKLASQEMTTTSDLDLIVIYDGDATTSSNGKRSLGIGTYYARLTQSFVTALTSPMAQGRLYEVDMRLRPSGRSGPVATSLAAFETYQREKAWTWEHLALTRARCVGGDVDLCNRVDQVRDAILSLPSERDLVIKDIADMRARIATDKARNDIWDVKSHAGGLLDIELFAQMLTLLHKGKDVTPLGQIAFAHSVNVLTEEDARTLAKTHGLLSDIQHLSRLLFGADFQTANLTQSVEDLLLKTTAYQSVPDLVQSLERHMLDAAQVIERNIV